MTRVFMFLFIFKEYFKGIFPAWSQDDHMLTKFRVYDIYCNSIEIYPAILVKIKGENMRIL